MKKMYDEIGGMDFPARTMTKEQQARILERAMECIEEERAAPAPTRRRPRFRWKFATAAAALCCLCAGGVAAAGYFLSPAQVAGQMEQTELSALFAGPDTVEVQQTQQGGNYTVTLLGLTSGGNVTGYWSSDWGAGAPPADRSYAVVAVAHTDGTPMAALDDEKSDVSLDNSMVSPLLAAPDCPIFEYNIFTMNGARYDIVEDGVRYILVETDSVEAFADKDPQLAVVLGQSGLPALTGNYEQDPATGAITPRAEEGCVSLLFDLPIDPSRADPERAQELRDQWLNGGETAPQEAQPEQQGEEDPLALLGGMTPAQVRAEGVLQSSGTVSISDGIYGEGWYYGEGGFVAPILFEEGVEQEQVVSYTSEGEVELLTHHADGTLTVEVWQLPAE